MQAARSSSSISSVSQFSERPELQIINEEQREDLAAIVGGSSSVSSVSLVSSEGMFPERQPSMAQAALDIDPADLNSQQSVNSMDKAFLIWTDEQR